MNVARYHAANLRREILMQQVLRLSESMACHAYEGSNAGAVSERVGRTNPI
jgi:hypothetical protein